MYQQEFAIYQKASSSHCASCFCNIPPVWIYIYIHIRKIASQGHRIHPMTFLRAMEETVHQEDLLRHLLSSKLVKTDDDFVYSFLLGSRLFLSPHQLLTELNRLANEESSSARSRPLAISGNTCSKCRQRHARPTGANATEPDQDVKGTDFRSPNTSTADASEICVDGEDTIRRRRNRGRRRTQPDLGESASSLAVAQPVAVDALRAPANRSSIVSRDSGILSAVIDLEDLDSANNNKRKNAATAVPAPSTSSTINDSGLLLDEIDRCEQCEADTTSSLPDAQGQRKRQLVQVLHEWVRNFPADFRNKKVMWTLHDIVRACQSDHEDLASLCTEVVDCISRRTAAQESYEQRLCDADQEDSQQKAQQDYRKTRDKMLSTILNLKDAADVNEMAQQLCLIEMDFLKHVGAEEFLQLFTATGDEDVRTNLGACVRWFNRLSHFVGTITCMCRKRKRARHVITFFARVADRCYELSNFNSSMAILTGLSLGPVTRLKRTWNKLKLSELTKLQNIFDPANNFLKYRTVYASSIGASRNAVNAGNCGGGKPAEEANNRFSIISQHSVASVTSTCSHHGDSGIECDQDSPKSVASPTSLTAQGNATSAKKSPFDFGKRESEVTIPFLVLLVKDVYFLNQAIRTVQKDGSINFEKLRQLATLLRPLEDWKMLSSPYPKNDAMQDFLLHTPVLDDAALYLLSYKREAPTNRFEKQQLKTLRETKKRGETGLSKTLRRKTM